MSDSPVDLSGDDEPSDNPTVPPPAGESDAYNAATVVKVAPREVLDAIKTGAPLASLSQKVAEHNERARQSLEKKGDSSAPAAAEEPPAAAAAEASLKTPTAQPVASLAAAEDDEPKAQTVVMPETVVRQARAIADAERELTSQMGSSRRALWIWLALAALAVGAAVLYAMRT